MSKVRAFTAKQLIRGASYMWGLDYEIYMERQRGYNRWWYTPYRKVHMNTKNELVFLATVLDNKAAGAQMAEEGWWGVINE